MSPIDDVLRHNLSVGGRWGRPKRSATIPPVEPPTDPDPPPEPPASGSLFAGHIPGRLLWGMAASESLKPTYNEALSIIGGQVYERRHFFSTTTTDAMTSMLTKTDAAGQYAVLSGKVPNDNWTLVVNGGYDSTLNIMRDVAVARRNAGKPAFAMGLHHEPDGDGPIGDPKGADRIANLSLWCKMQIYCSNYFAGWGTDVNGNKTTYNAANDVRDIMAWQSVANGNWWGLRFPKPDRIAAGYSAKLAQTYTENKSLALADFYDANPPNGDRDFPGGYATNADRASRQMLGYIRWARDMGSGFGIGCGEFSTTEETEQQRVFDLMMANRDIWAIANWFNNFANSRWEWRLIPDSYPSNGYINTTKTSSQYPNGFPDQGGSQATERNLVKFRALRTLSVSAQYTSIISPPSPPS